MPCRTYDDNDDCDERAYFMEEIDDLTRMLCEVMRSLSNTHASILGNEVKGLAFWWVDHLAKDKARRHAAQQHLDMEMARLGRLNLAADIIDIEADSNLYDTIMSEVRECKRCIERYQGDLEQ